MNELDYTKIGNYLVPDMAMNDADSTPLGRYSMLRETFLQEHHYGTYTSMLLTGRLEPHLREIDLQAQKQVERTVSNLKRLHGVDERMKADDQMAWVESINSFIAQAEEVVLPGSVYETTEKSV